MKWCYLPDVFVCVIKSCDGIHGVVLLNDKTEETYADYPIPGPLQGNVPLKMANKNNHIN